MESDTSYNGREKGPCELDREDYCLKEKAQGREPKSEWYFTGQRRMYPAILRTNRAIYFEAALLFYTRTTIILQTSDIVCLPEGLSVHDSIPGRPKVWRHNPLLGKGYRDAKGIQVYASNELNGDMEPHIFARLQRLSIDIWFDFDNGYVEPPLSIDRSGRFADGDEVQLVDATIRQSNDILNLVSLLSNSPVINHLNVELYFDMAAGYESGSEPLTEEAEALQEEEDYRLMDATEDRAAGVFLDNNMLAPLEILSNVKTFELRVDKTCNPQSHHIKMAQDLKEKIERNWQLSQAATGYSDRSFQLASTKKEEAD